MEWADFLASLDETERQHAEELAIEYGYKVAIRYVRYHPVRSAGELKELLRKGRQRVRTPVLGLYKSIDVCARPLGWTVSNRMSIEPDGTQVIQSDVTAPNGASGLFQRGYNASQKRLELRYAFLKLSGMTEALPGWIQGMGIPMVAGRGTPTVQYFTLYQFKILKVPAGEVYWYWRVLHEIGWRTGPFEIPGLVTSIKMSAIQNFETIVHLHWLRARYSGSNLSDLVKHTASVDYAETSAIQSGYRTVETNYVPAMEVEKRIGFLMDYVEAGNTSRIAENDELLSRYAFGRDEVMKMNFDIELRSELWSQ